MNASIFPAFLFCKLSVVLCLRRTLPVPKRRRGRQNLERGTARLVDTGGVLVTDARLDTGRARSVYLKFGLFSFFFI